ncbi:MAG: NADH-quinone oxidoreductase subunit C, partial [Thermomicrobiales bacterium]
MTENTDRIEQSSIVAAEEAPVDPWSRLLYFADDVELHPAVRELRAHFGDVVVDVVRFRDETTVHVKPAYLRQVCDFLKAHEELSFTMLIDLTALDMLRLRTAPRFDVVALIYSLKNRVRLRLKAGVDDGQSVPSLVPVWNGANWLER